MSAPKLVFLGDEATAAGLRLIGVETHTVDADAMPAAYAQHASQADVLLLGAEASRGLSPDRLARDLAAVHPLLLVLPSPRGSLQREDPAALIRRRLGIRDDVAADEAS